MKKQKIQKSLIEQWRESHTPEEIKKLYLESIPSQVWASMAFEGEHVDIEMLKEYLKTLKDTP